MTTATMPTDEALPAALAELVGWNEITKGSGLFHVPGKGGFPLACGVKPPLGCRSFDPLTDRNHSRLAVERCAEFKGGDTYYLRNLAEEVGAYDCEGRTIQYLERLVKATPAQESRAAYKTLKQWKDGEK